MNKIARLSLITAVLFSTLCMAQTEKSSCEVATWPGFCSAAISYTFDDGCSNQFAKAIPLFNEYNYKLTLFTVIDWASDWDALKAVAAQGHEVASHTVTHANLGGLALDKQTNEYKNAKDAIDAKIPDHTWQTFAYPYCATGDKSLCEQYYIAARGCQGFIEGSTPKDIMNISSLICGNLGSVKTQADFEKKFSDAKASQGWCVLLLHGVDDDGGYSPLPSTTLKSSLAYLDAHRDIYWVATFGDAVRYVKERDTVTVTSSGDHAMLITDKLDNAIYNLPLTLRAPLPQGWTAAYVYQDGHAVKSSIVEVDSQKYMMFEAVPDQGEVTWYDKPVPEAVDAL